MGVVGSNKGAIKGEAPAYLLVNKLLNGCHRSLIVMLIQPQRRSDWGRVSSHHARFFAQFILSDAEGLRKTLLNLS